MIPSVSVVSTLVLGGARSGKSRHAERLVLGSGLEPVYLATADAFDEEMTRRIARHRADRADAGWITIEERLDLPNAIRRESDVGRCLLVDCLTIWLTNVILAGKDEEAAGIDLVAALREITDPIVIVSNEVGLGIVPDTPLGRRFRDAQGRLNQVVAAVMPRVVFVAAGLPLVLKDTPP